VALAAEVMTRSVVVPAAVPPAKTLSFVLQMVSTEKVQLKLQVALADFR
jgi:hypothetical protein